MKLNSSQPQNAELAYFTTLPSYRRSYKPKLQPLMPLIIIIDMKVTKLSLRSEYYYETIIKGQKKVGSEIGIVEVV